MSVVLDVMTVMLAVVGAMLAIVASIGLHRLTDTRSRLHAATKPATLGVLCCGVAAILQLDSLSTIAKVVVIIALQLGTAPAGAHMLGRAIGSQERER